MRAPVELLIKLEASLKFPIAVMVFGKPPALMELNLSSTPKTQE
jgi:hypothetical protein